jgi:Tfp pilus assembly protein PilV
MLSQYSRQRPVSSEKHETAADPGAEEESWLIRVMTVTVVGGYRALPVSLTAIIRRAEPAKVWRFRTCGRLYSCDAILEGLPQDLQHMAPELRQLIQKQNPVVRQQHFPWRRHLAAAIKPTSESV